MDHNQNNQSLSPEDKKFREYISRGDDFIRIEIFRNALLWYKRALELKPDDPVARQKVNDTKKKIHGESRVIITLVIVAVVVVAVVLVVRAL
jgi:hypothetical protein